MFRIEKIDSDIGIIDRKGYRGDTFSIIVYANGAYSDKFGNDVMAKMLEEFGIIPLETERIEGTNQIFTKISIPGLPSGKVVGFRFPKEY